MDERTELLEGLSEKNCNYRIDKCTAKQNEIGKQIDFCIVHGYSTETHDKHYDYLCDIMDELCRFRRTHDCAIQGDEDYEMS